MINFSYLSDYKLVKPILFTAWIERVIVSEGKDVGEVTYIFCDDDYLLDINQKYLGHDSYTDIVTFDYTSDTTLGGDIFISIDRVRENAAHFEVEFEVELRRVMAHGILHLSGYGDKTDDEVVQMRAKEEEKMNMFHVEQDRA